MLAQVSLFMKKPRRPTYFRKDHPAQASSGQAQTRGQMKNMQIELQNHPANTSSTAIEFFFLKGSKKPSQAILFGE